MGWLPFSSSASRSVQCFYCCSTLTLLPPAPSTGNDKGKQRAVEGPAGVGTTDGFWCSVCGQITRRAQNGDILADDPAQFDSALNSDSFEKRASTSKTHLPPSFPTPSTTPFCRQCLANQSLQLHLLASYPSSSHSDSSDSSDSPPHARPEDDEDEPYPPLEEYRASLDLRYPLVCPSCAPAIESTIRERDYRVKAQALGWRLRESERAMEREERASGRERRRVGRGRWVVEGLVWRVRGGLWALTGVGSVCWCCCALVNPSSPSSLLPSRLSSRTHLSVPLAFLSLLWSFFDPTWDRLRTERARGKQVNVEGKEVYLALQGAAYLLRLGVAVVLRLGLLSKPSSIRYLSFALLVVSILALLSPLLPLPRLVHPPPIRLRTSSTPSSSTSLRSSSPVNGFFSAHPPPIDPLEPLAHLSLSRKGSLLARASSSPSGTPPGTPRGSGSGGKKGAAGGGTRVAGLGGIRPRLPSFSLGSIPWGRDLVGGQAMEVDLSAAAAGASSAGGSDGEAMQEDDFSPAAEDADNSMDWTPLPLLSPPYPPSRSSPFAPFSSALPAAQGNHISFPRQRLIPPDLRKPTGLEGMFERVGLREEGQTAGAEVEMGEKREGRKGWLSGLWRGG
ncbi:hypothetical protein JCM6882_003706 [Rhodosporidiobolus microsporus]